MWPASTRRTSTPGAISRRSWYRICWEKGADAFDVLARVERLDRLAPGAQCPSRVAFRVGLLNVRRVAQDQVGEVAGRRRAEDGAAVAVFGQQRKPARVVEVGVRGDYGAELLGYDRPEIAVARVGRLAPLEHPEIDEDAGAIGLDEIAGTGDLSGGAADGDFHRFTVPRRLLRPDKKSAPEPGREGPVPARRRRSEGGAYRRPRRRFQPLVVVEMVARAAFASALFGSTASAWLQYSVPFL